MRCLHTSDLHGEVGLIFDLEQDSEQNFDVWIDTGDFFQECTRANKTAESLFQPTWFREKIGARLVKQLAGRQVICVAGNHDYASLGACLVEAGHPEKKVFEIQAGRSFEFGGLRFAGFREIPRIVGEWNYEEFDLARVIEMSFAQNPDVLLTHTPPGGILDGSQFRFGDPKLAVKLFYGEHKVRYHLFGHIHVDGGKSQVENGISFFNGARQAQVILVH
jgi:Icc-related predicted phosphoesterase